jgi:poly(3-hydroxybutyrate) depolymerase
VPIIVFHGDRATTVHPRNGDRLLAYYWTNAAGSENAANDPAPRMTTRRGQVSGGYTYTCSTHHDAGDHAIAEQWPIYGLAHAWSGGSLPGSYTAPKRPDASAIMVRFFDQHPQREPVGQSTD